MGVGRQRLSQVMGEVRGSGPTVLPSVGEDCQLLGWGVLGPCGAQGPAAGGRQPSGILWAIYRQNRDGSEPRYYLYNAPENTALETLAHVGGSLWRIETESGTEKSDVGLDEYETRTWAGWHHHITICLLAGAFLLSLQQDWKKDAPNHPASGTLSGS